MIVPNPKTDRYHNYTEGDSGRPIQRKGKHLCYYKKGFWKRNDRKKFLRNIIKWFE